AAARRDGRAPPRQELAQVNRALYLAPESAFHAAPALRSYLEWETHRRAVPNAAVWYAAHHGGLKEADVLKAFGFVPVSADGAPYEYRARTDEVVNGRH